MYCYTLFVLYVLFVFLFKQKTAYEMRISDWSSDVCSSDLRAGFDRLCFGVAGSDGGRQRFGPEIGVLPILELCLALVEVGGDFGDAVAILEIGRASCRERVCQYV